MAARRPRDYLARMYFFTRFAPFRAIGDLRRYLARRPRHELIVLFLAAIVTTTLVSLLVNDAASITVPYQRHIIYVEQWRADRTDAEIRAQQKIDQAEKDRQAAELARLQKQRQSEFKHVDDQLKALGI